MPHSSFIGPIRALRRTSEDGAAPSIVKPVNYSGLPDEQIVASRKRRGRLLLIMPKKSPAKLRSARPGISPSLSGLDPDQVLGALLKVKPADVKRLEVEEKKNKPKRSR
jgi:hypothetical protein